ncbi:glutamate-ammonia-ligase adenylyltransferase [Agromyces rhizosphaerae]|uniref:Glutamate-ammonia-ligase adenylyltransferase n=1 Tax=Agromyces rhizosphaerae TaxID=88374 RepID=A0A9W6FT56_9MICO|nr:bifunctional [glutamine synthetase] adenylyltransferase/[glutamine synthetase]-adenylyl-L-tyrosine phosphorylase [Agromyces rhizosphaerae]GLI28983.1 glutamate-ammonia-ligase adenylyltransferase [Agromyces rhizosphaerae]
MRGRSQSLTALARLGFDDLSAGAERLAAVGELLGVGEEPCIEVARHAADPDQALALLHDIAARDRDRVAELVGDPAIAAGLGRLLGASRGLGQFFERHPEELELLRAAPAPPATAAEYRERMLEAIEGRGHGGLDDAESAWPALRVRYRRLLARIALYDLSAADAVDVLDRVAAGLADLAGATMDAALELARRAHSRRDGDPAAPARFPAASVAATRLAVIGMGKAGARELNYVSDVDVIFVAESADEEHVTGPVAIDIATRLAMTMMRVLNGLSVEPPLWEVDPNLRPEGKDGALVRSLESHLTYYDRWAKTWEFQALLKARPIAGDAELGARYVAGVAPKVWAIASRENFVESVQKMRERVTEHIPDEEVDVQLKLGPGGLRDIEFTVQLLQLVHGQADDTVHQRGTVAALDALALAGYVGRVEAAEFTRDYRVLRVMEHRLQLARLRRTHLMPRSDEDMRLLARATGLASTAEELRRLWQSTRSRVRGLHERLFYRPLLSAVAALPEEGLELTSEQAAARLQAIGFRDPAGALAHIAALTSGVSRRAAIQRHLLPVLLEWFADGADPDYGLLAFRRLSDRLGTAHWYLRFLRDSTAAALRLTRVLSGSRFVGELLDLAPESVVWLDDDAELRPRSIDELREEARAVLARHAEPDAAARVLRTMRRREVLRLAFSAIVGTCTVEELGHGLSDVTRQHIESVLEAIRRPAGEEGDGIEFGVIAMGRFGGRELGFGSDADVMYVFRPAGAEPQDAQRRALHLVSELQRLTADARLPLDLDADLRPEGRNGVIARSLDAYRAYYARWSLTWEAQALLRARPAAGDAALLAEFEELADAIRYPAVIGQQEVREVKRLKARVENERLPQGADPTRHLKLGRGSLSDVEWFVQLLQLRKATDVPALRTTSTLQALAAAADAELVGRRDAEVLRDAWIIASRARSALTLWLNKTTDVLPVARAQLEGVARLLEYPPGSATRLEEDYLSATRRARRVFERGFYGEPERGHASTG